MNLLTILMCVGLLTQISHVPDYGTDELFEALGLGMIQGPPTMVAVVLYAFAVVIILNFSLSMRHWVAIFNIVFTVLAMSWIPYYFKTIINIKMRVLRKLKRDPYRGQRRSDRPATSTQQAP